MKCLTRETITKIGSRTSNIMTTAEFQPVVVAPTSWFCAIGKSIAESRKAIMMSTAYSSVIAARFLLNQMRRESSFEVVSNIVLSYLSQGYIYIWSTILYFL